MEEFPLHEAVRCHDLQRVKYLVKQKENINQYDNKGLTPLIDAVLYKNIRIMIELIRPSCGRKGAKVNKSHIMSGKTPLIFACESYCYDSSDIVTILIENKANVNAQDKDGFTPLHYAAKIRDGYLVEELLKHGANPEIKNKKGQFPGDITSQYIRELIDEYNLLTIKDPGE